MPLTLHYVARSDVGLIREGNEDSGYAGPYPLAVADGMGGHAAGEVASQAAIEELVHVEETPTLDNPLDALGTAIQAANDRIRDLIADDPSREGMGTTVTALLWTGTTLCMGHIGDSRAYLVRDNGITQLSHDHTFVQSLVDEGRITEEEAGSHPARSLILKALQGQGPVEPDLEIIDVLAGDRLLVCSDGLSGVISDSTLAETLGGVKGLEDVADELIRLARSAGAPDNVTLIVADVVESETPRSADETIEAFLVGAAAGDGAPAKERSHRRTPAAALGALLGSDDKSRPDPEDIEAMRYAPRPPRRYRWVRRIAVLAVLAVLGWGALTLADNWVRSQYYVGHNSGEVAIFQGLSQELGPIRLSELELVAEGLPVDSLPGLYKDQVEATITAETYEDAEEIVATLWRQACQAADARQAAAEAESRPDPEPTSRPTATVRPDATASPGATNPAPDPEPTRRSEPTERAGATTAPDDEPAAAPTGSAGDGTTDGTEDGWRSPDADLDCTGVQ